MPYHLLLDAMGYPKKIIIIINKKYIHISMALILNLLICKSVALLQQFVVSFPEIVYSYGTHNNGVKLNQATKYLGGSTVGKP